MINSGGLMVHGERAVQAIKNFVEEDLFIEVSTTVTQHNIDEIPGMINFVRELGGTLAHVVQFHTNW